MGTSTAYASSRIIRIFCHVPCHAWFSGHFENSQFLWTQIQLCRRLATSHSFCGRSKMCCRTWHFETNEKIRRTRKQNVLFYICMQKCGVRDVCYFYGIFISRWWESLVLVWLRRIELYRMFGTIWTYIRVNNDCWCSERKRESEFWRRPLMRNVRDSCCGCGARKAMVRRQEVSE